MVGVKVYENENIVIYDNNWNFINLLNGSKLTLSEEEYKAFEKRYELYPYQFLSKEKINLIDKYAINKFNVNMNLINKKIESIQICISCRCNFDCRYCYQNSYKDLYPKRILNEDIDSIYKFCMDYNQIAYEKMDIKRIYISGGETLLKENISTINYIAEIFKDSKISILTNGVNICEFFDELPINNIFEFRISLDGNFETINSNLVKTKMSQENYKKILDGIDKVLVNNIKVQINTVVSVSLLNNYQDYLNILEEKLLNNDNVEIVFTAAYDYSKNNCIDENFMTIEQLLDFMRIFYRNKGNYKNIHLSLFPDLQSIIDLFEGNLNMENKYNQFSCGYSRGVNFNFYPDKNVYWCNNYNIDNVVGKYGENQQIYIEKINNIMFSSPLKNEKCKACIYRYLCNISCPLRKNIIYSDDGDFCGLLRDYNLIKKIWCIVNNNEYKYNSISKII